MAFSSVSVVTNSLRLRRFSANHANFIENHGEATTADVVALMAEGRRRVRERFGVDLEPEVQFVRRDGCIGPLARTSRSQYSRANGRAAEVAYRMRAASGDQAARISRALS